MLTGVAPCNSATIASIGRTVVVQELAPLPDFTYYQPKTGIWSTAELNLCIVCNCLTRLRPFLKRHFPRAAIAWSTQGKSDAGPRKPWAPSGTGGGSASRSAGGSWGLATSGSKRNRSTTKGIQITREYQIDEGSTVSIVPTHRDDRAV